MGLDVTSPAITEGAMVPAKYTCDGDNVSPPIAWSALPAGTASVVFIMTDPEDTEAPGGVFTHWTVANIPPEATGLPEGVPSDPMLPDGAVQGTNGFGRLGYGGPEPVPGLGPHRYLYQVLAVDKKLDLKPGMSRESVLEAMKGHLLAQGSLMAKY